MYKRKLNQLSKSMVFCRGRDRPQGYSEKRKYLNWRVERADRSMELGVFGKID